MKDNADSPSPRKTATKTAAKPAKATTAKSTTAKSVKTEAAAKPARAPKAGTAPKTPRTKKADAVLTREVPSEDVAVAAFLNWCQRRNQGLPDDPLADWLTAETEMGLAN